jgi:hypothetical protein
VAIIIWILSCLRFEVSTLPNHVSEAPSHWWTYVEEAWILFLNIKYFLVLLAICLPVWKFYIFIVWKINSRYLRGQGEDHMKKSHTILVSLFTDWHCWCYQPNFTSSMRYIFRGTRGGEITWNSFRNHLPISCRYFWDFIHFALEGFISHKKCHSDSLLDINCELAYMCFVAWMLHTLKVWTVTNFKAPNQNLQTILEGGITDQIRMAELITQDVSNLNYAMRWSRVHIVFPLLLAFVHFFV